MTDSNIGRKGFGRSGSLQRGAGKRFGLIDGARRQPSTLTNGASSIVNNESSISAEDGVETPKTLTHDVPQVPRKGNDHLCQIDENEECAMPSDGPRTFEFDADSSLRLSDYSFNTSTSFVPYDVDGVEEYLLDHRSQYTSHTLGSFPSVAVNSYGALMKDIAGGSSSTTRSESSATDTVENSSTLGRRNGNSPSALVATDRQSSFTTASYRDFRAFVYGNDKEEEVLSQLVSSLQNTNTQQENTIQQLLLHITKLETRLQSQDESKNAESNEDNQRPMIDPPAGSDDSNDDPPQSIKEYDDLVDEISRLTYQNGELLSRCHRLEEDENKHEERILALELDLRGENDDIRALANTLKNELVDFAKVHEDCKKDYETKLASLKDELDQAHLSKEELSAKMSAENDDAYQLCEILQREIDMLRTEMEEVKGSGESSSERKHLRRVSWADGNQKSAQLLEQIAENQQFRAEDDQNEEVKPQTEEHLAQVDSIDEERDSYRDTF
jgi:hypothetical protein